MSLRHLNALVLSLRYRMRLEMVVHRVHHSDGGMYAPSVSGFLRQGLDLPEADHCHGDGRCQVYLLDWLEQAGQDALP